MIDFESALVYFNCPRPRATDAHAMFECSYCDGNGDIAFYVGTLLSNLSIAAGLCAAWYHGSGFCLDVDLPRWHPGCGEPAPGHTAPRERR